jgi:hypothetical protein
MASERSLSRRQLLAAGSAAGLVAVLPRTVQADGSGDLVGSWEATVTATDPPLGEFASLMSFHPGGVFIESRRYYVPATPLGPLLETTGHGAWRKSSDGNFEVFFRFLLQEAPPSSGTPIGTDNIRLKLELVRASDTIKGTFESTLRDTQGLVIFTVLGTVAGRRITVG